VIAVITYGEWMVEGAELIGASSDLDEWRWHANIPEGPSPDGIAVLEAAIDLVGRENVRTGNAAHPELRVPLNSPPPVTYAPGQVGVYFRKGLVTDA
jgi:hypothetical protein